MIKPQTIINCPIGWPGLNKCLDYKIVSRII